MIIDCHNHTNSSDWHDKIERYAEKAIELWLDMCAITDHDKIDRKLKNILIGSNIIVPEAVEVSTKNYENDRYLHITSYSNNFNTKIDNILNKTIEDNILFVKKQIEVFSKVWFIVSFNDILEYYNSLWKNESSLNSSSIVKFFYNWKYSKQNIEIIKKMFWFHYDMYWFYHNVVDKKWKNYGNFKIDFNNDLLDISELWNIFDINKTILSIAHPNITFKGNIISFEKEFNWYFERWINAIEINTSLDKKWIESILKIKAKTNICLTFWSDCHKIWEKNEKHWDFWEMNHLLSNEIIKENYHSFRQKIEL